MKNSSTVISFCWRRKKKSKGGIERKRKICGWNLNLYEHISTTSQLLQHDIDLKGKENFCPLVAGVRKHLGGFHHLISFFLVQNYFGPFVHTFFFFFDSSIHFWHKQQKLLLLSDRYPTSCLFRDLCGDEICYYVWVHTCVHDVRKCTLGMSGCCVVNLFFLQLFGAISGILGEFTVGLVFIPYCRRRHKVKLLQGVSKILIFLSNYLYNTSTKKKCRKSMFCTS